MCVANIVYYGYLNVFLKHLIIHKMIYFLMWNEQEYMYVVFLGE